MRTEQWFHAADFLAPGGCTKLLRFYKVRTTQLLNVCSICFVLQSLFYYYIGTRYQIQPRNDRYPHLSSCQMADYILFTGYVHFITIKCLFYIQIQITAAMLKIEPSFLMYLYSVNGSSEIFIINVHLIGSSFPQGFFHVFMWTVKWKRKWGRTHYPLSHTG